MHHGRLSPHLIYSTVFIALNLVVIPCESYMQIELIELLRYSLKILSFRF